MNFLDAALARQPIQSVRRTIKNLGPEGARQNARPEEPATLFGDALQNVPIPLPPTSTARAS